MLVQPYQGSGGCLRIFTEVLHELQELRQSLKDAPKEETGNQLKLQLEQKESELLKLQEEASGMAKKLKSARRKSKDLRKELKNLPTGVVVRSGIDTLSILAKGGKLNVTPYPPVVDTRQEPISGIVSSGGRWDSKDRMGEGPLRFGDGLFLEYFLHRLFCMPDMIKNLLRLVEVQLLRVWRTGQLNAPALGHPEAYVEGVPMVEEIIRLWELSSIWICSHDSHGQNGNPSKMKPQKGKKIICEGPSNEDEIHRCVEFPPLPPEVATWFMNYAPTA
ncbi:hypothetical protein R1sor_027252 [Riccia sorocarpa]|uniref:Uncharacterized protein n=1 Tax=Riccia sorocarpa TaxID=122646 RepID=A0ABD3GHX1_9MARC